MFPSAAFKVGIKWGRFGSAAQKGMLKKTIRLADAEGLSLTLKLKNQAGYLKRPDVSWTRLAFSKA